MQKCVQVHGAKNEYES